MNEITDTMRIEFLEQLNLRKHYSGRCALHVSPAGCGWRLHETATNYPNYATVREAIDAEIKAKVFSIPYSERKNVFNNPAPA